MPSKINLDVGRLKDLYLNKGFNSKEIAKMFHCDYKTVLRRLTKEGLRIRHRGDYGFSSETKKKMSNAKIGIYDGEKNPMYGKHHSDQTKKKIRVKAIGRGVTVKTRKKISESQKIRWANTPRRPKPFKSPWRKKQSREVIEKIRKANTGKRRTIEQREILSECKRGSRNPAYIDGRHRGNKAERSCLRYSLWNEKIFKRDNWTCQECGDRSKKGKSVIIHAHHIKPFAKYRELRYDIKNGITLCKKCHLKLNGKEEDFIEYFNNKLLNKKKFLKAVNLN